MAPTIPVDAEVTPLAASTTSLTPALSAPLAPIAPTSPSVIPQPNALSDLLTGQMTGWLDDLREDRGDVEQPEDTHEAFAGLQHIAETADRYIEVFKRLAARARAEQAAELVTAVGQDAKGVPLAGMAFDVDGTRIVVTRKYEKGRVFEHGQAVAATIGLVDAEWRKAGVEVDDRAREFAGAVVTAVVETLLPSAAKDILITGLDGLVARLEDLGEDDLAKVAAGAYVGDISTYKKVEVKRETPTSDTPPRRRRIPRKTAPTV